MARSRTSDALGYYATLNVAPDASQDEVKRAFMDLARCYHPDKQRAGRGSTPGVGGVPSDSDLHGAAAAAFGRIQAAYEVLKDPVRREIYDTYGEEGLRACGAVVVSLCPLAAFRRAHRIADADRTRISMPRISIRSSATTAAHP